MLDPRREQFCFVIMPFRGELNFFYLYLRKHLQETHNLRVERADQRVLTQPLMDKIRDYIQRADLLIADITGRNPNVFYELGLADAYGKPVILLTQDPVSEAPSDIRHREFIKYDLAQDREILDRVDNAVRNLFSTAYRPLYERAQQLLAAFNADTGSSYLPASFEEFQGRVMRFGVLREEDDPGLAILLLPRILRDASDVAVMQRVTKWLSERSPRQP